MSDVNIDVTSTFSIFPLNIPEEIELIISNCKVFLPFVYIAVLSMANKYCF